ncbi:MAG: hypothetical protein F6K36_22630 [Symploca sp. SIO3C6]|nr:hypothetical protein [Symploca sp. SIO3C6]
MTKSDKISEKWFSTVYIGGVILAIVLGGIIIYVEPPKTWLLLIEGLCHLSILVYLGYQITTPSVKLYAGERIQTAGYLHTLIGFSVAMSLLGTRQINVDNLQDLHNLLFPMGSALLTSIMGWLFGGEIAEQEKYSVDQANLDLLHALKNYSQEIREFKNKQTSILQGHQSQILDFYKQNSQELDNKLNKLVVQIGEYNELILVTFNQFNSMLEDESQSLRHTFNQLNSVIEEQSYSTLPRVFNQLGSVIEENSHSLSTSFEDLQSESQKVAESMSNTTQFAQNTADNLSETAEAARTTANYLKNTDALIQQLEELLKYILKEKMKRSA